MGTRGEPPRGVIASNLSDSLEPIVDRVYAGMPGRTLSHPPREKNDNTSIFFNMADDDERNRAIIDFARMVGFQMESLMQLSDEATDEELGSQAEGKRRLIAHTIGDRWNDEMTPSQMSDTASEAIRWLNSHVAADGFLYVVDGSRFRLMEIKDKNVRNTSELRWSQRNVLSQCENEDTKRVLRDNWDEIQEYARKHLKIPTRKSFSLTFEGGRRGGLRGVSLKLDGSVYTHLKGCHPGELNTGDLLVMGDGRIIKTDRESTGATRRTIERLEEFRSTYGVSPAEFGGEFHISYRVYNNRYQAVPGVGMERESEGDLEIRIHKNFMTSQQLDELIREAERSRQYKFHAPDGNKEVFVFGQR